VAFGILKFLSLGSKRKNRSTPERESEVNPDLGSLELYRNRKVGVLKEARKQRGSTKRGDGRDLECQGSLTISERSEEVQRGDITS